ncbi:hypothetical protein DE146DRAFT_743706 [Phaeosphaeria sp. MPI-PUGE-AT-0046c]|nr:hypothetical protein DE146DRAFT_743706 [Phaeosphaeria sp. MPI-PUGE-AT-0046c]
MHNISGWENSTVGWDLGLLTVTYPLTSFGSILQTSDEVKRARVHVPRSMIFSVTTTPPCSNVDRVSTAPLPIIEGYHQATGSRSATTLFVSMLSLLTFVFFCYVFASVPRLVQIKFRVPVKALCSVVSCLFLLAIINIGSSTAFHAFISLPALALYISYCFPTFFLFLCCLNCQSRPRFLWGPSSSANQGPIINLGAISYIDFVLTWMPFPGTLPADRWNMNYAGPMCINGKKRFKTPVDS